MGCLIAKIFGCAQLTAADKAARKAEAENELMRHEIARLDRRVAELQDLLSRRPAVTAEVNIPAEPIAQEAVASAAPDRPAETDAGYKGLAVSLIQFRDQLAYFKDECAKEGDMLAVKVLGNLFKETGRFMKLNGVEPLEEAGIFDAERQTVASTASTGDPLLDGTIAETFRPGYRIGGELYRTQEVVLYTYDAGA